MNSFSSSSSKNVCLIILDGWGHNSQKTFKDAIEDSDCKHMKHLSKSYKSFLIHASGEYVGLTKGSMGNSEVGHLTLGSGRIVKQNSIIIDEAFNNGTIRSKLQPIFSEKKERLHLIGMLSDGGIHSHIRHIIGIIEDIHSDFGSIFIHCISDGRDTAPDCFITFYEELIKSTENYDNCFVSSVGGRYYAMDRDNNYERTEKYFQTLTNPATSDRNIKNYIKNQYLKGKNDENIVPALFHADAKILPNDFILFCNFRADRMRQITRKFFENGNSIFTLTEYDKNLNVSVLFKSEVVENTLADILEFNKIEQVHIAETEKYAHVTYFFNGGNERTHDLEERIIIDSKKAESFDEIPEMSSELIADEVTKKMLENKKFIVANFAAPDMVGHTGNYEATLKAVEFIDKQIEKISRMAFNKNYMLIITADHGNAECMFDEKNNKINKKHTTNKVPLIIAPLSKKIENEKNWEFLDTGYSLKDVAPTILEILKIEKPTGMTGTSILNYNGEEENI